jgi:hypothetical protein
LSGRWLPSQFGENFGFDLFAVRCWVADISRGFLAAIPRHDGFVRVALRQEVGAQPGFDCGFASGINRCIAVLLPSQHLRGVCPLVHRLIVHLLLEGSVLLSKHTKCAFGVCHGIDWLGLGPLLCLKVPLDALQSRRDFLGFRLGSLCAVARVQQLRQRNHVPVAIRGRRLSRNLMRLGLRSWINGLWCWLYRGLRCGAGLQNGLDVGRHCGLLSNLLLFH